MSDNPFALSNIQRDSEGAARVNDNPFSLANIERDQQAELRGKIKSAVTVNPDQAAEADKLAKRYPVPQDVLARNLLDVKMQAAVDDADAALQTSPKLARALREKPWLAQQSHDDIGTLAQIEQFFRDTGGSVKAGVFNASKGAAGVFRAGTELAARLPIVSLLDYLEPVTAVGGNPLRRFAEGFDLLAQQNEASAKAATPKTKGNISSGFQSGIQSLTQNTLMLPLAFLPGGQPAALAGMTAFTGGQSYQDARDKGLPMTQALPFAASQAAIEWATERAALGALIKDVKVGAPIFQLITNQLKNEIPGEQVATILQDLNEWAVLNPEKPFSSYLEARPSAAAQTLVATIVGAGGNVAIAKGIESVMQRGTQGAAEIENAERAGKNIERAMNMALQSKLRERNPETFKQLVQQLADEDGGTSASVFIDGDVLLQAVQGMDQQALAQAFPSLADQLNVAASSGGVVELPIGEVLTAVPGTPLEQVFLQNMRANENALSLAEAKQAADQAEQFVKTEADRVMTEAADQQAWAASAETVKTTILDQLNTAGRFTSDVNEAYATLVRDFYAVTASRQGITPEEMYARYPLRVGAQTQTAGPQLEQGGFTPSGKTEFDTGKTQAAEMFASFGGYTYDGKTLTKDGARIADAKLRVDGNRLVIDDIETVRKGQGDGTAALQAVIAHAHQNGLTPALFTDAMRGKAQQKRLREYYPRLGFVANKGDNKIKGLKEEFYYPAQRQFNQATFDGPETGSTPIGDAQTVTVDGKTRPALNSKGQPIHPTLEGVRNFWRWFGDSKVVDAEGKPLVVYHGTNADFQEFTNIGGTVMTVFGSEKVQRQGFFFTPDEKAASTFGTNVMPVYLAFKSPFDVRDGVSEQMAANMEAQGVSESYLVNGDFWEKFDGEDGPYFVEKLRAAGYDGVRFNEPSTDQHAGADALIAFDPTQIKSATGNSGAFSGQDANILRQGSQRFSEDNRLSNLNPNGASWTRIRENNPALNGKGPDDVVTVYRATIGDTIRPDDFVAVDKSTLRTELKNVRARDGKAAKIIEQQVRVRDLLIGNDASEFVYYPEETLNQQARGTFSPSQLAITLNENADLSTFLHESGHFFLEVMADLASQPNAPADVQADMSALLKWFGIKGNEIVGGADSGAPLAQSDVPSKFAWVATEQVAAALEILTAVKGSGSKKIGLRVIPGEDDAPAVGDVLRPSLKWKNGEMTDKPLSGTSSAGISTPDLTGVLEAMHALGVLGRNGPNGYYYGSVIALLEGTGSVKGEDQGERLIKNAKVIGLWQKPSNGLTPVRPNGAVFAQDGNLPTDNTQPAGRTPLETWRAMTLDQKRPYHEKFAESFEQYLLEGKAPNTELQPLFRKFRSWMLNIYKSLTQFMRGRDLQLSDDVRQVFDRMLATDEQIKQAEEAAGLLPNFEATNEAIEKLQARSLRDLKWAVNARNRFIKKLQKEAAALRKDVEAEVRAEVEAMPVYAAQEAIARIKGEASAEQLETIAETVGYTSASQMLAEIATAGSKASVIEGMTDQRMLERHGDLVDQRAIEEAANEAVHNEARARSLATELKAQSDALNPRRQTGVDVNGRPVTVNALVEAVKQFAQNLTARRKVKDLKSSARQHRAAEARAGKRWQEATAAGKTEEAIAAKRDQLLNNYTTKALLEVDAEVRKIVDYLAKFDKDTIRKKLPAEYLDQIDALRENMDLRTSVTGRELERRASLRKWVESQQAMGLDPIVPDELLDAVNRVSYKEMTVEELRAMRDVVKNIEHLGRLKSKLLAAKDKREFDAVAEAWSQEIRTNGGKPKPVKLEGDSRIVKFFKGAWADHRKLNSLIRQFAGGADNSEGFKALIRSMNERGTQEDVMVEKAAMDLAEIHKPIEKLPGGFSGAKLFIPEINNSLTRAGRLSVALNWGNEQNRQRLRDGDNWSDAQVEAILRTLTPTELTFVNNVWEYLDSYWPEVKAKQERVSGVVEEKVEAEPFIATAADGTLVPMRGGYYPIKYDGDRSLKSQKQEAEQLAKDMLRGAVLRPSTRRGHTKARVDEVVGRPVKKDLSVITQHVTQVVHDLAWHEWAIDANRLMNDPRIASAVRDHYGAETHRAMTDAVEAIVVGDVAKQSSIDQLLLKMRANVTRSIMGASLTTALLQPFGLTQSMARIGVVPVLKGAGRWAGDAARMESTVNWVREKSNFMRLRSKTFNRELREISQRVQGKSKFMQVADASLFMLMQKLQMVADIPTWVGAYEKALNSGLDEATAVQLADEAVLSSQGGGNTRDLSAVQRDLPFLTQFYSYFNTTLNLVAEKTATTDFKNPRAAAGWVGDMLLLVTIPAILPALITFALKGGGEDDDPEKWAKRLAEWQAGYMLGMFVGLRELPALWSPFDYGGPPAAKLINDGRRLVQQANQGEVDDQAVLATIGFLGTALGLPTTQVIRSYKGWLAWDEGNAPPSSILFGPPPKD